jgi:mannose-6-phosphate isomerase-like protein (cupin superfamily)
VAQETGSRAPWMTRRDEAETVWFLATRMTVLASVETTDGALGLIDCLVPPGFSPPLHVHSREDEPMYVIEGRVRYQIGDGSFEAGPGSFVFLPRGVPHTFIVEGDRPARILEFALPGGLERFHVDAGVPAQGPGLPPPSPPDLPLLDELAGRYGVRHIGPPMTPRS